MSRWSAADPMQLTHARTPWLEVTFVMLAFACWQKTPIAVSSIMPNLPEAILCSR